MICDVIIIKDGLPLFSKNFSISNINHLLSQEDNLIMVSGFFSALNSFSDSFESMGTISELKLSNNNLKLSFLKDSNVPDLIYLATYDSKSELIEVQQVLHKISNSFLNEFSIDQISNWNGKLDYFKKFEYSVEKFLDEENKKVQDQTNNKIFEFFNSFVDDDIKPLEIKNEAVVVQENPEFYEYVPNFTTSKKINPKYYLTGDTSIVIYEKINGKKTVNQISIELNVDQNQVYNVCKNLIKLGFISFN